MVVTARAIASAGDVSPTQGTVMKEDAGGIDINADESGAASGDGTDYLDRLARLKIDDKPSIAEDTIHQFNLTLDSTNDLAGSNKLWTNAATWVTEQLGSDGDLDSTRLTDGISDEGVLDRMEQAMGSTAKDGKTPRPDKLKNMAQLYAFLKQSENYLSRFRGAGKCPLTYVVRDIAVPTDEMYDIGYPTHDSLLVALTDLNGPLYEVDNKKVFEILKALVVGSPAEALIERFELSFDGRGAFESLKARCEGVAEMELRAKRARRAIDMAVYGGETRYYDYSKHVKLFQDNLEILELCDEPMNKYQLSRIFLNSIHSDGMDVGIAHVRAHPIMIYDFHQAQLYLAHFVEQKTIDKMISFRAGSSTHAKGKADGR